MNSNWEKVKLGDLIERIIDHRGKTPKKMGFEDFHAHGYPVLSAKHVKTEGLTNLDSLRFANDALYKKWMKEEVQEGDIILTSEAPLGELYYISGNDKYLLGQRVFGLRPNKELINPLYLFSWLASKKGQDALYEKATGSTVQGIKQSELLKIDVFLPPRNIQDYIAKVSFSVAGKIKNNKETNKTLKQMAHAIFKSWFVDFEPVKAKIAVLEAGGSRKDAKLAAMSAISGKDADSLAIFEREQPEKYAELSSTAELFPSAMQDIESVQIPKGWNLVPLSNIASFASGKINVSKLTKDTYISTENMLVNKMGVECATSLPSANTTPSFNSGHILISNIRPYFKKIWLARFSGGRSADVLAFEHKKNITAEYLYNVLYQDSFFDFMMQTSKGVKMPRGDKKAIMEWSCIEPTVELVRLFSNKLKEFYSYIESHNKENTQLSLLRDTLLPKLLSGEVTLPHAEEIAKEADYV
ncbi:TPA: restriction endonuclease subunit S [Klebsiella aerogenes]|nr:restriction endonuclease subunit S [Klebsiella aerogenes]